MTQPMSLNRRTQIAITSMQLADAGIIRKDEAREQAREALNAPFIVEGVL